MPATLARPSSPEPAAENDPFDGFSVCQIVGDDGHRARFVGHAGAERIQSFRYHVGGDYGRPLMYESNCRGEPDAGTGPCDNDVLPEKGSEACGASRVRLIKGVLAFVRWIAWVDVLSRGSSGT